MVDAADGEHRQHERDDRQADGEEREAAPDEAGRVEPGCGLGLVDRWLLGLGVVLARRGVGRLGGRDVVVERRIVLELLGVRNVLACGRIQPDRGLPAGAGEAGRRQVAVVRLGRDACEAGDDARRAVIRGRLEDDRLARYWP